MQTGGDPWGFGEQGGGGTDKWSGAPVGGPGGFDDTAGPGLTHLAVPAKPPALWLVLSGAASVAGGALAGVFGADPLPAATGWLLCGPVALILLAVFVWRETQRRAQPTRVIHQWTTLGYTACLVLAGIGIFICACRIAMWAGRNLGSAA